jgi:hypothetical protein
MLAILSLFLYSAENPVKNRHKKAFFDRLVYTINRHIIVVYKKHFFSIS